jgi:hypothetical protein
MGINAKSFPEIALMQVRCYTDSRYVVNDSRNGGAVNLA